MFYEYGGKYYDKDGFPVDSPGVSAQPQFYQPPQPQSVQPQSVQSPPYGVVPPAMESEKSMVIAALLAYFLGNFGAHNFYLGYTKRGLIQLGTFFGSVIGMVILIGFFTLALLWLWVMIELILIVAGAGGYDKDAWGRRIRR